MLPVTPSIVTFDDLAQKYLSLADVYSRVPSFVDGAALCKLVVADVSAILRGEGEQPIKLSLAAQKAGYSRDHLRRMIRERKLTSYRRGRTHLVRLSDIPKRSGDSPGGAAVPTAPTDGPTNTARSQATIPRDDSSAEAVTPVPSTERPGRSTPVALDVALDGGYDPAADARQMAAIRGRGGKV